MYELLNLFGLAQLWPFCGSFKDFTSAYKNALKENKCVDDYRFCKTDYGYRMDIDVDPKSTEENVKIELKNSIVKIDYEFSYPGTSDVKKIVYTNLPQDADENTLDAEMSNGKLSITVKKG